jgi:hypothetical protein
MEGGKSLRKREEDDPRLKASGMHLHAPPLVEGGRESEKEERRAGQLLTMLEGQSFYIYSKCVSGSIYVCSDNVFSLRK